VSDDPVSLDGLLPFPLAWHLPSAAEPEIGPDRLAFAAGPRTDLFADPGGEPARVEPPLLLGVPAGDYQLSARVSATFDATFDAAALIVWSSESSWAKLALERSPQGVPTIVTVVTRGLSDDVNSLPVPDGAAWLRVSRLGPAYAFHASLDGAWWSLIRYFTLDGAETASVGFSVQSPTGEGAHGRFDAIAWRPERLAELRDGS
jgi:regulation of enolase protein 1 (concanavalin A-like superfamily)